MAEGYTFVLVHGGGHDGSAWRQVAERLEEIGHVAHAPTVAGHGKNVPKNVTHADQTRSIVDFIVDRDLSDIVLVGHGYGGTIISKAVEAIPERVRRLVFLSGIVLNDGECAIDPMPFDIGVFAEMAAESADDTFAIPFEMWRDVFINDGDPDLVERTHAQLSSEPLGPWSEPLDMKKFHELPTPRSYLVGTEDLVMGDVGWHPFISSRLGTFRLVEMPGSHELIFTNPIGVADKIVEAGRD
jgi:pimeloyl-ACP methyl ester carboxylesterase